MEFRGYSVKQSKTELSVSRISRDKVELGTTRSTTLR